MLDTAGKFAGDEVEVVDRLLLKREADFEVDEAGLEGAKLPFGARFVGHMCSLGDSAAAGNCLRIDAKLAAIAAWLPLGRAAPLATA